MFMAETELIFDLQGWTGLRLVKRVRSISREKIKTNR